MKRRGGGGWFFAAWTMMLLFLGVASLLAQTTVPRVRGQFAQTVSVTAVNAPVVFKDQANLPFKGVVIIENLGPNTVYVDVADTVSDTSKYPLVSGRTLEIGDQTAVWGLGLICATGETATVKVLAIQVGN
jgi:hypothetical protein